MAPRPSGACAAADPGEAGALVSADERLAADPRLVLAGLWSLALGLAFALAAALALRISAFVGGVLGGAFAAQEADPRNLATRASSRRDPAVIA